MCIATESSSAVTCTLRVAQKVRTFGVLPTPAVKLYKVLKKNFNVQSALSSKHEFQKLSRKNLAGEPAMSFGMTNTVRSASDIRHVQMWITHDFGNTGTPKSYALRVLNHTIPTHAPRSLSLLESYR